MNYIKCLAIDDEPLALQKLSSYVKKTPYLQLVGAMLEDANFAKLDAAVEAKDAKAAFEAAHALKGALGNLALTPVCKPVEEITEKLRGQDTMPDIADLYQQYKEALEELKALQ